MDKKKSPNGQKPDEGPSSRKDLFIKVFLCSLICLWMFVLGLLVGRGTAPVRFDIERLQDKLASLKAATIEETVQQYQVAFHELDREKKLGFHEELQDEETKLPSVASTSDSDADSTNKAPVKTEAPAPKKTKDSEFQKTSAAETSGAWTIQVAATQDKAHGSQLVERLEKLGYPAYLAKVEIADKGIWYRVRVGGYANRTAAETDLARLKKERFSPMIVSPGL